MQPLLPSALQIHIARRVLKLRWILLNVCDGGRADMDETYWRTE